jgi:hypothetical protein
MTRATGFGGTEVQPFTVGTSPAIPLPMKYKIGDKVNVKMLRGAVQSGTVTKVFPDGRIEWDNGCNFRRVTAACMVTADAPREETHPDAYIQQWFAEEEGE